MVVGGVVVVALSLLCHCLPLLPPSNSTAPQVISQHRFFANRLFSSRVSTFSSALAHAACTHRHWLMLTLMLATTPTLEQAGVVLADLLHLQGIADV